MILYKFKSLDKFDQVSDLLLARRLYCPTPAELNDPLEGILGMRVPDAADPENRGSEGRIAEFWSSADAQRNRYRLCCFSGNPDSVVMWSYYCNAHSGICLELDMSAFLSQIEKVSYVDDLSTIDHSSQCSPLKYKLKQWMHENEYRLILDLDCPAKYVDADIKSVLMGAGTKPQFMRPLFEICHVMGYPLEIFAFDTAARPTRVRLRSDLPWDEFCRLWPSTLVDVPTNS